MERGFINNYKVGDKVKLIDTQRDRFYYNESKVGDIGTIVANNGDGRWEVKITTGPRSGFTKWWHGVDIKLMDRRDNMARRTFKQLKDSPEFKKGAIWQENCDDGDQNYTLLTAESIVAEAVDISTYEEYLERDVVEGQPKWFEEVFNPGDTWFTKEELEAFKAFVKKAKK